MIIPNGVISSIDGNLIDISSAWLFADVDVLDVFGNVLSQPVSIESTVLSDLRFNALSGNITIRKAYYSVSEVLWSGFITFVDNPSTIVTNDLTSAIISLSANKIDKYDINTHLSTGVINADINDITKTTDNFTVSACQFAIYSTPNFRGQIYNLSASSATFSIPRDGNTNLVVADYNNGNPYIRVTQNTNEVNQSNIIALYAVWNINGLIHSINFDNKGEGLSNKIDKAIIDTTPYRRSLAGGLLLSTSGTNILVTSAIVYAGTAPISVYSYDSSINTFTKFYHSSGSYIAITSAYGQFDNVYYDDGTNLQTLSNNKFANRWIYRTIGDDKEIFIVYGIGQYNNSTAAQLESVPTVPGIVNNHGLLIGRIIIQQGSSYQQVESAFTTIFSPSQITNHNDLDNIQGGSSTNSEYYHLSASTYSYVQGISADVQNQLNSKINVITLSAYQLRSEKGTSLGYAGLDSNSKIYTSSIPDAILGQLHYAGTWNAATNTPTLATPNTISGNFYIVTVSGTTIPNGLNPNTSASLWPSGTIEWKVGDWIISDGTYFDKCDNTDAISTWNGRTGAIVPIAGDYTATQITNTPTGNLTATNVQTALNQLDTDKLAKSGTYISAGLGLTGGGFVSASPTISLATTGTSGTYTKVTTDSYGRVVAGMAITSADLPQIGVTRIGNGDVSNTQLSYLNTTSANVQIQLSNLSANNQNTINSLTAYLPISGGTLTGLVNGTNISANNISATNIYDTNMVGGYALVSDNNKKFSESGITSGVLNYLTGTSANIQSQFNTLTATYIRGDGINSANMDYPEQYNGFPQGAVHTVNATSGYPTSTSGWLNVIDVRHRNGTFDGTSAYGGQLVWGMTTSDKQMYYRARGQSWNRVWDSSNLAPITGTGSAGYVAIFNGTSGLSASTITTTKLNYLTNVSADIQNQINTINSQYQNQSYFLASNENTGNRWVKFVAATVADTYTYHNGSINLIGGYQGRLVAKIVWELNGSTSMALSSTSPFPKLQIVASNGIDPTLFSLVITSDYPSAKTYEIWFNCPSNYTSLSYSFENIMYRSGNITPVTSPTWVSAGPVGYYVNGSSVGYFNTLSTQNVSNTQFGYLSNVSADVQYQLSALSASDSTINSNFASYLPISGGTLTGTLNGTNISANNISGTSINIGNITNTEFGYLDNVSANIQTQINQLAVASNTNYPILKHINQTNIPINNTAVSLITSGIYINYSKLPSNILMTSGAVITVTTLMHVNSASNKSISLYSQIGAAATHNIAYTIPYSACSVEYTEKIIMLQSTSANYISTTTFIDNTTGSSKIYKDIFNSTITKTSDQTYDLSMTGLFDSYNITLDYSEVRITI